jgi:hypothetical protein
MINKLKIFAIALMAAGATVATTRATPITYVATNILQPVSVTLTVYEQKPVTVPTIFPGQSFKTKDLLTAVESALGTTPPAGGQFSKKAEIALLTSNLVQFGPTNVVTNLVTSVANTLLISTNSVVLGGTTNLTIGDTAGSYYVTVTATNGTTNLLVTTTTIGPAGPVSTTTGTSGTTLTLDANQTLAIGTNAAVGTETNLAFNGAPIAVDSGDSVSVISNGVVVTNYDIGTNSVAFTTNSVTLNGNTNTAVTFYTNEIVEITNTTSTNVIANNGTNTGFGASNAFTTSLTTTFTVGTNGSGLTNVTIVTSTTDLVTNSVTVTNTVTVPVSTNTSTELVVADGVVNTPIPTNILDITVHSTNIIGETFNHLAVLTAETEYSIMRVDLNSTALTNAADNVSLSFQGLVKSTYQDLAVGKTKYPLTNFSWSDISGYGTNNGTPIVVGGTLTIQAPVAQKIP